MDARWSNCLANPFDPRVIGTKVPDYNSYPSAAFHVRETYIITTNAAGNFARAFKPRIKGAHHAATEAGGTITWGAEADVTNYNTISALYQSYRVVAMGANFRYIGNRLNAGGRMQVALVADTGAGGSTNYPTTNSGFSALPLYSSVTCNELIDQPWMVTSKMVDVDAIDYRAPDTQSADGYTDILIFIRGAEGSVDIMQVDLIWHLEALPISVNVGVAVSPAARLDNVDMSRAAAAATEMPVLRATPQPGKSFYDMLYANRQIGG